MKSVVYALLFALVLGFASAAQNIYSIDSFSQVSDPLVIVLAGSTVFPATQSNFVLSDSIFSGERDLYLEVDSGPSGMVFSTSVIDGDWTSSAPSAGDGFALLQYDGKDGSSTLNPSGGTADPNTDFTNGSAFALRLRMSSDQATTVEVFIYSGSSTSYCSHIFSVPGNQQFADYIINYSDMDKTGSGCDFKNVGAVELVGNLAQNVDLLVQFFATYGDPPTTPTPSRAPAQSKSATPRPPSSRPSTAPTNRPCNCVCPAFHCVLEYDPSGENTYYYQTSDINPRSGGSSGSSKSSGGNSSDASSLSACFALLAALIVLLF